MMLSFRAFFIDILLAILIRPVEEVLTIGAIPAQSELGQNLYFIALAFDGFADDLFTATISIDGSGVDSGGSAIDRCMDGFYGFGLFSTAPHPATNSPRTKCDARDLNFAVT